MQLEDYASKCERLKSQGKESALTRTPRLGTQTFSVHENIDNFTLTAQKWTYRENGGMNQDAWASRSFFPMHVSWCLR